MRRSYRPRKQKRHFGGLKFFVGLVIGGVLLLAHTKLPAGMSWWPVSAASVSDLTPPQQAHVDLPASSHLRQTPFDCGAFNLAAILASFGGPVEATTLVSDIGTRKMPNQGVMPEVLVDVLDDYGHGGRVEHLRNESDANRVRYLKQQIAAGHPVILLGVYQGYLHFITVFGYEGDDFFVYNPFLNGERGGLTLDANGDALGNQTYASDGLLKFWEQGSYPLLGRDWYAWTAVVAER